MIDRRLLLLAPEDNVLVLRRRISAGERFSIEIIGPGEIPPPEEIIAGHALDIGHKIARHHIAEGAEIRKYGAVIGIATAPITAGAHVHLHNVRSNYTPSHTLAGEADT